MFVLNLTPFASILSYIFMCGSTKLLNTDPDQQHRQIVNLPGATSLPASPAASLAGDQWCFPVCIKTKQSLVPEIFTVISLIPECNCQHLIKCMRTRTYHSGSDPPHWLFWWGTRFQYRYWYGAPRWYLFYQFPARAAFLDTLETE